jgi:hypothetical protein
MRLPEFITFTGADDETAVGTMRALSERFPVEWGVLFSPSRQGGEPRYPNHPERFLGCRLRLAAHLCGGYSRAVMERDVASLPYFLRSFGRVQVNHASPLLGAVMALRSALGGRPCIVQMREATQATFPDLDTVAWLFDQSGGRGVVPAAWPAHPGEERLVGYAGGIGPENVLDVLAAIDADGPYWIDMESGVRTDDRFDLEKCRRVCEFVYGVRAQSGRTA